MAYRFTHVHITAIFYRNFALLGSGLLRTVSQRGDILIDDDTFFDSRSSFAVGHDVYD